MILQRFYSDNLRPKTEAYNVKKKVDDKDFEEEINKRVKRDKKNRRIVRSLGGSLAGFGSGLISKKNRGKKIILGTLGGAAISGLGGELVDKIIDYDKKQEKAKEKAIEKYKEEEYKGYKGIDKRSRLREKYLKLNDLTTSLKDIN